MRSTRLIVDCSELKHNIAEFKNLLSPDTQIMAVVKANAYGHGLADIAKHSLEYGASWLGVATPEEGVFLRNNGINAPILVLGASNGDELRLCVENELHQTIFERNQVVELNNIACKQGKKAYAHIKVNTGMNRIGVSDEHDFELLLNTLKACGSVEADGIFTHFACADEENDQRTFVQISKFEAMIEKARQLGFDFKTIHACNTAGTLRGLCKNYGLVRLGIGIYGYYPSEYMKTASSASLHPIAKLVTNISAVNTVKSGDEISYGGTFKAQTKMRVATLPVGYADGYSRKLSSVGYVVICGKKAQILGRVCMDQLMVDISGIDEAHIGTEAILMGDGSDVAMTADDIAQLCGTVSYEVLTSIAQRVERIYTGTENM